MTTPTDKFRNANLFMAIDELRKAADALRTAADLRLAWERKLNENQSRCNVDEPLVRMRATMAQPAASEPFK